MRSRVSEGGSYAEKMDVLSGELRQWYELGEGRYAERDAWRAGSHRERIIYDHMPDAVDYGKLCFEAEYLWADIAEANTGTPVLTVGDWPTEAYIIGRTKEMKRYWGWTRTDIEVEANTVLEAPNCVRINRSESEEYGRELYIGGRMRRCMFSLEMIAEVISTGGSLTFRLR